MFVFLINLSSWNVFKASVVVLALQQRILFYGECTGVHTLPTKHIQSQCWNEHLQCLQTLCFWQHFSCWRFFVFFVSWGYILLCLWRLR